MADFEDAMQVAAARACGARHIVTRKVGDYEHSPIRAVDPRVELSRLLQVPRVGLEVRRHNPSVVMGRQVFPILRPSTAKLPLDPVSKPESTEGGPWGQPLKKREGAP